MMGPATYNESIEDFDSLDLYHDLLAAPHITPQPTSSRHPPSPNPFQAYTLFSDTLFTPSGLRAIQSFLARSPSILPAKGPYPSSPTIQPGHWPYTAQPNDLPSDEWLVLVSLGTGLNGPGGIVHGGIAMTLLDSAMAVRAVRAARGSSVVTTRYEADFRKKIKAPCVVLCRASLDERFRDVEGCGELKDPSVNGDKDLGHHSASIHTKGTVEDGRGNVYLQATAHFVNVDERAKARL